MDHFQHLGTSISPLKERLRVGGQGGSTCPPDLACLTCGKLDFCHVLLHLWHKSGP